MAKKKKDKFSTLGEKLIREREQDINNMSVEELRKQKVLDSLKDDLQAKRDEFDYVLHNIAESTSTSEYSELANDAALVSKQIEKKQEAISKHEEKLSKATEARTFGAQKAFQQSVQSTIGEKASTSRISKISKTPSMLGTALSTAEAIPSNKLEKTLGSAEGQLDVLREEVKAASKKIDKDDGKAFKSKMTEYEAKEKEVAELKSASGAQKKLGIDTASTYYGTKEKVEKIQTDLEKRGIAERVKAGQFEGREKEQEKLDKISAELVSTFEKLAEAIKTGSEDIDTLSASARQLTVEQSKQEKLVKEIAKQEQSGASKTEAMGALLQNMGAISSAGGGIYRQWTVQRDMDTSKLQTGFIGIANQRFDDAGASARGDMGALLRIREGTYSKAAKFGSEIGKDELKASTAEAVGGVLTAVGSIFKSGATAGVAGGIGGALLGGTVGSLAGPGGTVAGAVWGSRIGVTLATAASASDSIKGSSGQISSIQNGTVEAAAMQSGYQTKFAEDTARQHMDAVVLQRAMDFTRQSWRSTAGAGSNRESILSQVRNPITQQRLAETYGMDQEQILNTTQAGISALGKRFKMSDVEAGARATNAGLTESPEQYIALRGQIAQQGGTKDNLETILRNAVASGMDSSKNIMEMTRTISGIAAQSSAGGVSTFGGAAQAVARSVEALKESGTPEDMRAQAAQLAAQSTSDILNKRNIDLPSIVQSAEMLNKLGLRPGTVEGEAASKLKPEQIGTLLKTLKDTKLTPEQKQQAIDDMGQGMWSRSKTAVPLTVESLETLSIINKKKVSGAKLEGWNYSDKERGELINQYNTDKEKMSVADRKTAEAFFSAGTQATSGTPEKLSTYEAYTDAAKDAKEEGYTPNKTDTGLNADMAAATRSVTEYSAGLEKVNGNLQSLVDTMKKEASVLNPKEFQDVISKSAGRLDESVKALSDTVDRLNLKLGGKEDRHENLPQPNTDQGG